MRGDGMIGTAFRNGPVGAEIRPDNGGACSLSDEEDRLTLITHERTDEDVREFLEQQGLLGHWEKPIKKTIYTLNIGNYEPVIRALTFPLLQAYAAKIGADLHVITERKFPFWPITYEKLQVHELAKRHNNDWSIFFDADVLINPECFDFTDHLTKDTVAHNGKDMAGVRWKMDQYFRRDGRMVGSCNWLAIASDWCLDLWRPLDDLTPEQALARINVTINEHNSGECKREHLIDDFTLSRNIARFGLKYTTITEICGKLGWVAPRTGTAVNRIFTADGKQAGTSEQVFTWGDPSAVSPFLFHCYAMPTEQKIEALLRQMTNALGNGGWALMSMEEEKEFRKKWGLEVRK